MIPKLNLKQRAVQELGQMGNQSFEHLSELKLTDITTNVRLKLALTLLNLLATTKHYYLK